MRARRDVNERDLLFTSIEVKESSRQTKPINGSKMLVNLERIGPRLSELSDTERLRTIASDQKASVTLAYSLLQWAHLEHRL